MPRMRRKRRFWDSFRAKFGRRRAVVADTVVAVAVATLTEVAVAADTTTGDTSTTRTTAVEVEDTIIAAAVVVAGTTAAAIIKTTVTRTADAKAAVTTISNDITEDPARRHRLRERRRRVGHRRRTRGRVIADTRKSSERPRGTRITPSKGTTRLQGETGRDAFEKHPFCVRDRVARPWCVASKEIRASAAPEAGAT